MNDGGPRDALSYQQMVEYVARVTDPMEQHMSAHDKWHLERLTAEQAAFRANRISAWAVTFAAVGIVVEVVLALALHH